MTDEGRPERVGTLRDWPGKVLAVGVVLVVLGLLAGGPTGTMLVALAAPVLAFGVVALLIRRGAFTPRR